MLRFLLSFSFIEVFEGAVFVEGSMVLRKWAMFTFDRIFLFTFADWLIVLDGHESFVFEAESVEEIMIFFLMMLGFMIFEIYIRAIDGTEGFDHFVFVVVGVRTKVGMG